MQVLNESQNRTRGMFSPPRIPSVPSSPIVPFQGPETMGRSSSPSFIPPLRQEMSPEDNFELFLAASLDRLSLHLVMKASLISKSTLRLVYPHLQARARRLNPEVVLSSQSPVRDLIRLITLTPPVDSAQRYPFTGGVIYGSEVFICAEECLLRASYLADYGMMDYFGTKGGDFNDINVGCFFNIAIRGAAYPQSFRSGSEFFTTNTMSSKSLNKYLHVRDNLPLIKIAHMVRSKHERYLLAFIRAGFITDRFRGFIDYYFKRRNVSTLSSLLGMTHLKAHVDINFLVAQITVGRDDWIIGDLLEHLISQDEAINSRLFDMALEMGGSALISRFPSNVRPTPEQYARYLIICQTDPRFYYRIMFKWTPLPGEEISRVLVGLIQVNVPVDYFIDFIQRFCPIANPFVHLVILLKTFTVNDRERLINLIPEPEKNLPPLIRVLEVIFLREVIREDARAFFLSLPVSFSHQMLDAVLFASVNSTSMTQLVTEIYTRPSRPVHPLANRRFYQALCLLNQNDDPFFVEMLDREGGQVFEPVIVSSGD